MSPSVAQAMHRLFLGAALSLAATSTSAQNTCPRDVEPDTQPLTNWQEAPTPVVPTGTDAAQCWITPAQAHALGTVATWVDVRALPQARSQPLTGHPGSLQIPLAALDDKTFLRPGPTILVGQGWERSTLTQACLYLKKIGFTHIQVLAGGARAAASARSLDTTDHAKHGIGDLPSSSIPAAEYWLGSLQGNWRVITVGLDAASLQRLPAPPANTIAGTDTAQLSHYIQSLQRQNPPDQPPTSILIVSANTATQAQLHQALWTAQQTAPNNSNPQTTSPPTVYWLQDGLQGYQHYAEQQHSVARNAGRSLARPCGA